MASHKVHTEMAVKELNKPQPSWQASADNIARAQVEAILALAAAIAELPANLKKLSDSMDEFYKDAKGD